MVSPQTGSATILELLLPRPQPLQRTIIDNKDPFHRVNPDRIRNWRSRSYPSPAAWRMVLAMDRAVQRRR